MRKIIAPSVNLAYISLLLLFGLEIFTNPLVLSNRTGINATLLALIFSIIYLVLIFKNIRLSKRILRFSALCALPLLSLVLIIFSNLESTNYTNYVLENFRHHYKHLLNPLLFIGFIIFASQEKKWWTKNLEKFAFFLAFAIFALALTISIWPFNIFMELVKEDGPVEYIQAFSFFISGVLSLIISYTLLKKFELKFIAILYLVFALGLIFIAGDEISWGQRLFNFTPPEIIAEDNNQNELTIHNLSAFEGSVQKGYILIGLYGSFVSLLLSQIIKTKSIVKHLFITQPFVFPYFLALFSYNYYTSLGDHVIGHWSEPAEMMFALGVLFFVIKNLLNLKSTKNKS